MAEAVKAELLTSILFNTLAYTDKLSGYPSPYSKLSSWNAKDEKQKPSFLTKKKAFGSYDEDISPYIEIMYTALLSFKDPVVCKFFRLEIDTKNFLVWLRCKEKGISCDKKIIQAGDWHPLVAGQGSDMGIIPERDEIIKLFQKGEWDLLVQTLFSNWRKRLGIIASFRSDTVIDMIFTYLDEEESRWKIRASL